MSKFKNKRVLIVGFGVTGVSVARFMCKQGAKVVVTDIKQKAELNESLRACVDLKLEFDLGRHTSRFFTTADLVVVSPGVPGSIKPLEEAREAGVAITSEVDLAAAMIKEPIVAVTGTNGKTTTTTLLGKIFEAANRRPFVGGNIGKPMISYAYEENPIDVVVSELSSFQLGLMKNLIPACAIFTNISEDHLDRYSDMQSYVEAKRRLLQICDRNSYVVLNHDDSYLRQFGAEHNGKVFWFTRKNPMEVGGEFAENFRGAYHDPDNNRIVAKITGKDEYYDLKGLKVIGDHNKENLMAAICAARALGVPGKKIQDVIRSFEGVPHRLEFVRRKNGVYFFNDSKATNVASVSRSLGAFKRSPIILIAGGRDKDSDFGGLATLVRGRCKTLVLLGEAKEKINRAVGDFAETYLVGTFEEAVLLAYQKSQNGDIILLSPGCSSHDMFRNFEERGDYFKKLVSQI